MSPRTHVICCAELAALTEDELAVPNAGGSITLPPRGPEP